MRIIGVIRLSVSTDESTSPERQREKIETWAAAHGHTVTGWAEDIDVSGKIAPAMRPELGPWLRQPDRWDALVAAKPDRISRSLRDFLNLWHDLDRQGKTLVSLDPELDFGTPMGRLVANVLMSFAQFEREMISDRVKDAYQHIRQNGGYAGGQVPFGYQVIRKEPKGWAYEHDPVYAPIVREMVDRALAGESMRQIAIWLNSTGIPTSRNVLRRRLGKPEADSVWSAGNVKSVFMSPAIAGLHAADGNPLRIDGENVQRCEGIIDRPTWERLKKAITGTAHGVHRVDANPLLAIGFCGECGAPLYTTSTTSKGKVYAYYRCSKQAKDGTCSAKSIPMQALLETFEFRLLSQIGDVERVENIPIPGENHDAEIADVDQQIADLEDEFQHGGTLPARSFARLMAKLESRRDELAAMPRTDDTFDPHKTGQTYRQHWAALDTQGRRKFMLDAGIKALCVKLSREEMADMKIRQDARGILVLFDEPALDELRRLAAEA
jgi:site-specific DNA recombinase